MKLAEVARALAKLHGDPPVARSPLEAVLRENVAYLVDDDRREAKLDELRRLTQLEPAAILAAPHEELERISGKHAWRLVEVARIVEELGGDLDAVLAGPLGEARKAAKSFPGFGDPGADHLLLLAGRERSLAPDSNALRVLARLGF